MLTESQERFIAKIPEEAIAQIRPWDSDAADYAKSIVQKFNVLGLEVFWEGSLALGISGENDIDLCVFSEPNDFSRHMPGAISILGEPTYTTAEKILWRIKKDGHKIDAGMTSKDSSDVKLDIIFYTSLSENPALLNEYEALKTPGLAAREYYRRKNEFYNRVTGNK